MRAWHFFWRTVAYANIPIKKADGLTGERRRLFRTLYQRYTPTLRLRKVKHRAANSVMSRPSGSMLTIMHNAQCIMHNQGELATLWALIWRARLGRNSIGGAVGRRGQLPVGVQCCRLVIVLGFRPPGGVFCRPMADITETAEKPSFPCLGTDMQRARLGRNSA